MRSLAKTSLIVEITVGDFFPASPFNADLKENDYTILKRD